MGKMGKREKNYRGRLDKLKKKGLKRKNLKIFLKVTYFKNK